MTILAKGRLRAFDATSPADLARAMVLRAMAFPTDSAGPDDHDKHCAHVLIEDTRCGHDVCTFRLLALPDGREIHRTYAAQHYALDGLRDFRGRMLEIGRFCIHPDYQSDPDVLRLAWAALTRIVDREGAEMLFGCASFEGTQGQDHADAFALLHDRHVGPARWRPRVKAPRVERLGRFLAAPLDPRRAMAAMPPLLRTYLGMGGWVSDHAVVDEAMGTMHVFTGVEIRAIPPARARLLRAMAG